MTNDAWTHQVLDVAVFSLPEELCAWGYETVLNTSVRRSVKLNLPVVLMLTGLEQRGRRFVKLGEARLWCVPW